MTRSLGWNRPTDKQLARCKAGPHVREILDGVIPAETVDLSYLVTVLNQLNLGSCVLNAIAQAIHAEQVRTGAPPSTEFMSRLMAYYCARLEDGNQDADTGTQICTGFDAVSRMGFCPESIWPYQTDWFKSKPPMEAVWAAYDQRGQVELNYHRLDGPGVSKAELLVLVDKALTAGRLVTWGAPVSNAYCSNQLGPDPVLPPIGQPIAGGHAQALCGKNTRKDGKPSYRNVNSWGTDDFGEGGFCDIDPKYITWDETTDLWMVSLAPRFSGGAS